MWNSIKINNDIYMISIIQKDDTIKILLTNLIEIWMETLTKELILDRCKKLNPLLCVEALNYNDILKIFDMSECIVEASVEQIKLRTQIEGGPMKFVINFIKGTTQDFWEIITKPLCISSMEIIRQHKFLLDLMKKKDEEIAEYKAEGAELIRKNIETKPFKEDEFKIAIPTPSIVDCINAFQRMADFYNELNLYKCTTSRESASSSNRNNKIQEMEQNITRPVQDDNKSAHEVENASISRNIETTHLEDEKRSKDTINRKVTSNKKGTANMVYRPIKKLKKGLNESIL